MTTRFIKINEIKDLMTLVSFSGKEDTEIVIRRGRYAVDGASLLGVLSLDPSDGIAVEYEEPISADFDNFLSSHQI